MPAPPAPLGGLHVLHHVIEKQNLTARKSCRAFDMLVDRRVGLAMADHMAGELIIELLEWNMRRMAGIRHDPPMILAGVTEARGFDPKRGKPIEQLNGPRIRRPEVGLLCRAN